MTKSKSRRFAALAIAVAATQLGCLSLAQGADQALSPKTAAQAYAEQLRAAREASKNNPDDAKAHFQLADLLHKVGRNRESSQEYLEATSHARDMYIAYHQLAQVCDDPQQLDEAIARLQTLKEEKPKELMLRIALSELYEKRQNYHQSAHVLVEMVYDSGVPEKYRTKVNARIHYLLTKAKEVSLADKDAIPTDDELDVVPAPLPDVGLRKGLTASKIKESKEMKGMGHVPLLP